MSPPYRLIHLGSGLSLSWFVDPAFQYSEELLSSHDLLVVHLPIGRKEQERPSLPAAQPTMAAYQFFEGRDLVGLGIVKAVDEDVRGILKTVGPEQVPSSIWAERSEGIGALDTAVAQIVPSLGPDDERSMCFRMYHYESDPLVLGQAIQQARVEFLDLL
jgi:hypothetical protein